MAPIRSTVAFVRLGVHLPQPLYREPAAAHQDLGRRFEQSWRCDRSDHCGYIAQQIQMMQNNLPLSMVIDKVAAVV